MNANLIIIYIILGAINLIFISDSTEEFIKDQNLSKYTNSVLYTILLFLYILLVLFWPFLFIAYIQDKFNK